MTAQTLSPQLSETRRRDWRGCLSACAILLCASGLVVASQAEVIPLLLNILEMSFAPSRKSLRVEVSGISFSKGSRALSPINPVRWPPMAVWYSPRRRTGSRPGS